MKFSMRGQEKKWPFNTGDRLIEVTSWAGLIVYWSMGKQRVFGITINIITLTRDTSSIRSRLNNFSLYIHILRL